MKSIATSIAVVIVVAAVLFAGSSDYDEAVREQAVYCQMVSEGSWPDYNGNFKEVCHDATAQR